jgi:rhodanese-related sulfurtransferase
MGQFFEFIGNHLFLFLALFAVSGALAWNIMQTNIAGVSMINAFELTKLLNHEDALVVDVRQEQEFIQGHILNSINIPLGNLSDKMNRLEKYREKPIIAVCLSGQRSAQACGKLKKQGFEKVYNLSGGIMAWQSANLPLTRGKE